MTRALLFALALLASPIGPCGAMPAPAADFWIGTWRATMLDGRPVTSARAPNLTFTEAGALSGWTGCNRFGASWSGTPTAFRITPGMTTRMACIGPDTHIEADFLRVIAGAARLERQGNTLIVWTARGRSEFVGG